MRGDHVTATIQCPNCDHQFPHQVSGRPRLPAPTDILATWDRLRVVRAVAAHYQVAQGTARRWIVEAEEAELNRPLDGGAR